MPRALRPPPATADGSPEDRRRARDGPGRAAPSRRREASGPPPPGADRRTPPPGPGRLRGSWLSLAAEPPLQGDLAPVVVGAGAARRDAEHPRGLVEGHLLVEDEMEHLALAGRQLSQGCPQSLARLGLAQTRLGARRRAGVSVPPCQAGHGPQPPAAPVLGRGAAYDAEQPGPEAGPSAEAGTAVEDLEIGHLQHLLRLLAIPPAATEGPTGAGRVELREGSLDFVVGHRALKGPASGPARPVSGAARGWCVTGSPKPHPCPLSHRPPAVRERGT